MTKRVFLITLIVSCKNIMFASICFIYRAFKWRYTNIHVSQHLTLLQFKIVHTDDEKCINLISLTSFISEKIELVSWRKNVFLQATIFMIFFFPMKPSYFKLPHNKIPLWYTYRKVSTCEHHAKLLSSWRLWGICCSRLFNLEIKLFIGQTYFVYKRLWAW